MLKDMDNESKMDWVYSQLEDKESRFIYNHQRLFRQNGNYELINEIIDNYVADFSGKKWYPGKEESLFQHIRERGKRVIIFGAGIRGKRVYDICINKNIVVDFFCDSNVEVAKNKLQGHIPVIMPGDLLEKGLFDNHVIIVSPRYGYQDIVDRLLNMGGEESDIYVYSDYVRESLETQYFEDGIISLDDDEVFIDAGCYDFDTSKIFVNKMHRLELNIKRIYAFEPDSLCFQKCKNKAESLKLDNVILAQAGLWSSDSYVAFEELGNDSSHILLESKAGGNKIRTVALDSYIDETVTFIKMDIEGAELEALKGAENIILRDKPKLAICIYHKEEDLWEIPYYIKRLVPEYKLYVRHYSNCQTETVLYAVCNSK